MTSLHEWQRAFSAAAVFNDAAAVASLRIVASGMTPEARIGIYRANVLGNYRRALAATYPVIKRLVGAPFALAALASVPAQLRGELCFSLHPSAHLIVSTFPILHIWQANQPACSADERIDLDEGGDTLLVLRRPSEVGGIAIERISHAEHLLLVLLAAGRTLDEAANRCAATSPEFDLAAALRRQV